MGHDPKRVFPPTAIQAGFIGLKETRRWHSGHCYSTAGSDITSKFDGVAEAVYSSQRAGVSFFNEQSQMSSQTRAEEEGRHHRWGNGHRNLGNSLCHAIEISHWSLFFSFKESGKHARCLVHDAIEFVRDVCGTNEIQKGFCMALAREKCSHFILHFLVICFTLF